MRTDEDREVVADLLGREPRAAFEVVVRDRHGAPVVIRNAPFLDDATPMPTRYWLVDPDLVQRVSGLESSGGCRRAENAVPRGEVERVHRAYAVERESAIPPGYDGPRPSGGVGGTRVGVKCLHAHLAHHLATGDDPVGAWVQEQLDSAQAAR